MPTQAETIEALRKAKLPVDPTYQPAQPVDPMQAVHMFGSALGINDAIKALRGEMTPDEAERFAVMSSLGVLPGAEGLGKFAEPAVEAATKTMGELLPDTFKAFPDLAKLTPKEYLQIHANMGMKPTPAVMQAIKQPNKAFTVKPQDAVPSYDVSGSGNYPLDQGSIDKQLAQNPGASIFDVAGVPAKPKPYGGLKLALSSEPGDFFIHDQNGQQVGELTSMGKEGGWHLAMTGTPFTTLVNSPEEGMGQAQQFLAKATPQPRPAKTDYSQSLYPIDWQNYKSSSAPAFPNPETQQRAASLGFNTQFPLYKGGTRAEYPEVMFDPIAKKSTERGNFLSDKRDIAESYTSMNGTPLQYIARAKNPAAVDWPSAVGAWGYEQGPMHDIIEAARNKGHDLLVVKGLDDIGGANQNQYVVLDQSILRAPTAKFNPTNVNQPWPLAGIAGIGTAGAMSPQISEYIKALQNGDGTQQ